jgi:outer membrane biosynthesis protein TonB
MINSSATKKINKFYYSDAFISYVISIVLHLFILAMLFMQFNKNTTFNTDNFIVTNLVTSNEIDLIVKKTTTVNKKPLIKNNTSKVKSTDINIAKATKKQQTPEKKTASDKPETKTNINYQQVDKKVSGNANNGKEVSYYSQQIQQEISQNWKKPYAFNVDKPSIVQIKLDAKGNILSIKLLTSSNNKLFDESIINAIESSSPLESIKTMDIKTFTNNFTIVNLSFNPEDLD